MAIALFLCCDLSFWQLTTIPVGIWVSLTAENLVDMLASCSGCPECVHFYIVFLHIHIDIVLDLGINKNSRKRGMPSFSLIIRRYADKPVYAHSPFMYHMHRGLIWLSLHFLCLLIHPSAVQQPGHQTNVLGPFRIYSHQHLGPVLAFDAAGPRMDDQDSVVFIHFSGEYGYPGPRSLLLIP